MQTNSKRKPYVSTHGNLVVCYVVRICTPSNNVLHYFLSIENTTKIIRSRALRSIPDTHKIRICVAPPRIDTDTRLGFARTNGEYFGRSYSSVVLQELVFATQMMCVTKDETE